MDEFVKILTLFKDPAIIFAGLVVILFYRLMLRKEDSLDKMRVSLEETVRLLNRLINSKST